MEKKYDGDYFPIEPMDVATDGPSITEALAEYRRITTAAETAEHKASIGFNENWASTLKIDPYGPDNSWADSLMHQSYDLHKNLNEARERANAASRLVARLRETAGTNRAALDEAEREAQAASIVYTAYLAVLNSICHVDGVDGYKARVWMECYGHGKSISEVARLLKTTEGRIWYLTKGIRSQSDFCMAIGELNNAYAQNYDYNDDVD